jgi:bisphosphoglycerate-independent phosphoglycerate mutase (AlkP superfamily)
MAVIMATAVDDRETAINAMNLGAYSYVIKPFFMNEFLINIANVIKKNRLTKENQKWTQVLETRVRERTADVQKREEEIALRLISAAGYRDEETGEPHTAHTNEPVPFILVDRARPSVPLRAGGALCDVAPTVLALLRIPLPTDMTGTSVIETE